MVLEKTLASNLANGGAITMSLSTIVNIMKQDDGFVVMFDLYNLFRKNDTADFAEALKKECYGFPELMQRVLVETYNREMIDGVYSVSDEIHQIVCLHDDGVPSEFQPKEISMGYLQSRNIHFISQPWNTFCNYKDEMTQLKELGFCIFSKQKDNLIQNVMWQEGVDIINVDYYYRYTQGMKYWLERMLFYVENFKVRLIRKIIKVIF